MEPLSAEAIERLEKLGGRAFVGKMIDLFLDFAREKVGLAVTASAQGDFDAIGKAAHALKSSAANVGAIRVQDLAADLEERMRAGQTETAAGSVQELQAALEEVIPLLEARKLSYDAPADQEG